MHSSILSPFFTLRRRAAATSRTSPSLRRATSRWQAAFSMIELMAVMALITLVAGISVPAVKGVTGGNSVDASASKLSGLLTLARSEAIAQHTIVRFVVATDWAGKGNEANMKKMSLWIWRSESSSYEPLTKWEELPTGMIIERQLPTYIQGAQYAQQDASTVRGSSVLDPASTSAEFPAGTAQEPISSRFIEFLPSGSARIPSSADRRAIFVATQGFADGGQPITYTSQSGGRPNNWAQVNVDTLTGRVHVYRP